MPDAHDLQTLSRRLTDLFREVGTLLIAFTPLDYSLQQDVDPWSLGGLFGIGALLFVLSVLRERRLER